MLIVAMLAASWTISVVASFSLGYRIRWIIRRLQKIERTLKRVAMKPKPVDEPKSVLVDPDDVAARARREHDELMRKLNP